MDSIVLRDRNGKEINYHGIDYLNVKTPDGEKQGYAAYDPETLVPENLVSGVKVGDVEGALEVPQAVETTIAPDFSAGDMEVSPEDGKVFSKVGILKPANLLPENIAKDVDVGGIVGTLEGGGGTEPYIEYTLNENEEVVAAKLYGFTTLYPRIFTYVTTLESVDLSASPGLKNIPMHAFNGCTSLTDIVIPDSVTSIGDYAFQNCTSLKSIVIPDSVTSIGNYAFKKCTSLTSVTIGSGVTNIPMEAFYGCTSLTDIVIPDSVTTITGYAFQNCTSLTSVTIGSGVTNIRVRAFSGCSALTSATFKNTSGWYVTTTDSASSGTSVTVTDTSTAATYLWSTYYTYYWYRNV